MIRVTSPRTQAFLLSLLSGGFLLATLFTPNHALEPPLKYVNEDRLDAAVLPVELMAEDNPVERVPPLPIQGLVSSSSSEPPTGLDYYTLVDGLAMDGDGTSAARRIQGSGKTTSPIFGFNLDRAKEAYGLSNEHFSQVKTWEEDMICYRTRLDSVSHQSPSSSGYGQAYRDHLHHSLGVITGLVTQKIRLMFTKEPPHLSPEGMALPLHSASPVGHERSEITEIVSDLDSCLKSVEPDLPEHDRASRYDLVLSVLNYLIKVDVFDRQTVLSAFFHKAENMKILVSRFESKLDFWLLTSSAARANNAAEFMALELSPLWSAMTPKQQKTALYLMINNYNNYFPKDSKIPSYAKAAMSEFDGQCFMDELSKDSSDIVSRVFDNLVLTCASDNYVPSAHALSDEHSQPSTSLASYHMLSYILTFANPILKTQLQGKMIDLVQRRVALRTALVRLANRIDQMGNDMTKVFASLVGMRAGELDLLAGCAVNDYHSWEIQLAKNVQHEIDVLGFPTFDKYRNWNSGTFTGLEDYTKVNSEAKPLLGLARFKPFLVRWITYQKGILYFLNFNADMKDNWRVFTQQHYAKASEAYPPLRDAFSIDHQLETIHDVTSLKKLVETTELDNQDIERIYEYFKLMEARFSTPRYQESPEHWSARLKRMIHAPKWGSVTQAIAQDIDQCTQLIHLAGQVDKGQLEWLRVADNRQKLDYIAQKGEFWGLGVEWVPAAEA